MADSSSAVQVARRDPTMSVSESNREYSNYKGVMLCNRPPIIDIQGKSRSRDNSDSGAFTCGVIAQSVGMNSISLNRSKCLIVRSRNSDGVLSKHRKWLADLQKRRDESILQNLSDEAQKKQLHDKFSEHESKLRKLAKAQDSDDLDVDMELNINKTSALTDADMKSSSVDLRAESKGSSGVHSGSKALEMKAARSSSHSSSRPAWALSQDVAVAVLEEEEVDDEEALLSFAEDLDFDRYMGDMEKEGVIERLSLRIAAMEKEAAMEDQREDEYQRRAEKKKELQSMTDDSSIRRNEDMATSSVRFIDEEEKSIQHQYSGAGAARSSLKVEEGKEGVMRGSQVLHHPIVVVHADDDGARLMKHLTVANLPFLYRNPGV